jgi:hypothetical protein
MKRVVIAVVLSLFVAMAGGAWAQDVQGTVKVIEVKERVMTLDDGTKLFWTETHTIAPEIKAGAKVKASYEAQSDGKLVLKKIEIVK